MVFYGAKLFNSIQPLAAVEIYKTVNYLKWKPVLPLTNDKLGKAKLSYAIQKLSFRKKDVGKAFVDFLKFVSLTSRVKQKLLSDE